MSNSRQTFRKLGLINNVSSTNQPSINLVASPVLNSSYVLTLPSSAPTATGQSLISDTSGNLSWGASTGTVSTYTGTTNPLSTPTNVTGLLFTTTSTQVNVFVAVNATANIYAVYQLFGYQKGTNSAWGLGYSINGDTDDDPNISFSITSTGQVQYVMGTVTGFTSVVMMWTLGTAVSNTLTSLALSAQLSVAGTSSLADVTVASTLGVTGQASFGAGVTAGWLFGGSVARSGSIGAASNGMMFSISPQTFTDTGTAASSTNANAFNSGYFGIPTLASSNTGVTTTTASTVTIAGPPAAGTNTTITNAYPLSVLNGNALFSNGYVISGNLPTVVLGGTSTSQSLAGGNQLVASNVFSVVKSTGATMASTGSNVVTISVKGIYAIRLQLNIGLNAAGNLGCFILGSDGNYYAVGYSYTPSVAIWIQCVACEEIPAGVTLTPYVYTSTSGTISAANSTLTRFTVACVAVTK